MSIRDDRLNMLSAAMTSHLQAEGLKEAKRIEKKCHSQNMPLHVAMYEAFEAGITATLDVLEAVQEVKAGEKRDR